jgi:hypothetical protein
MSAEYMYVIMMGAEKWQALKVKASLQSVRALHILTWEFIGCITLEFFHLQTYHLQLLRAG